MKPILYFTILFTLWLAEAHAQTNDADSQVKYRPSAQVADTSFSRKSWGIAGIGLGSNFLDGVLSLNRMTGKHQLFTAHLHAGGFIGAGTLEAGALYGWIQKKNLYHVSVSAGLSIVSLKGYSPDDGTTLGIPIAIQLFLSPTPRVGIGLQPYFNINPIYSYGGANLCLQFGNLWDKNSVRKTTLGGKRATMSVTGEPRSNGIVKASVLPRTFAKELLQEYKIGYEILLKNLWTIQGAASYFEPYLPASIRSGYTFQLSLKKYHGAVPVYYGFYLSPLIQYTQTRNLYYTPIRASLRTSSYLGAAGIFGYQIRLGKRILMDSFGGYGIHRLLNGNSFRDEKVVNRVHLGLILGYKI